MQQQKKPPTSYFTFVVLIFLGTFIYLGWMLSNSDNANIDEASLNKGSQHNTPAMALGTSEKSSTKGLQLIPEKEENIAEKLIKDVKPVEQNIIAEPVESEESGASVPKNIKKIPAITKKVEIEEKPVAEKVEKETESEDDNSYQIPTNSNIYIVRPNDTLTGIAKQVLGSSRRWREIARLNTDVLPNPHQLKPGIRLRLPADNGQTSKRLQNYTVRKTDSLYSIAVKFYGTPKAVSIIRKANPEELSDTTALTPGMVIKIPQKSVLSSRRNYRTAQGSKKYTIKSGDTLSDICKTFITVRLK